MISSLPISPKRPASTDRSRLLEKVRRIVVKVGSSTIARNFDLDIERLDKLVDDLVSVKQRGLEVILVTSGAIAAGAGRRYLLRPPQNLPGLQAAAAVGQSRLMHAYETRFQHHDLIVAMMLLTQEDFNSRERYTYMSDTLRTLLRLGVVPIINENDTVGVEEIKVGDNDTLAAYVTNLAEADLLIILSDQNGFYTADPRRQPHAEFISLVPKITDTIKQAAQNTRGGSGVGGMSTKLRAAEIVTASGEMMVLAHGDAPQVVNRILRGEEIGTLFLPQKRIPGRKRWIAYTRSPKGVVYVDNGARNAILKRGTSLLPSGVRRVEGSFGHGDTVSCMDENEHEFAKGLVNYDAAELIQIMGKRTGEIKEILGYHYYDEVIHRDHMVVIGKA